MRADVMRSLHLVMRSLHYALERRTFLVVRIPPGRWCSRR